MKYAEKWKSTAAYVEAAKRFAGPEWWYTDPLVLFMRIQMPEELRAGPDLQPRVVHSIMDAIDALDGFHGGNWPALDTSLVAVAHVLWSEGGWEYNPTSALLNLTGAAIYDARVAVEREQQQHEQAHQRVVGALLRWRPGVSWGATLNAAHESAGATVDALAAWSPGQPWPL